MVLKRKPGRPAKSPEERVRRIVAYVAPWAHDALLWRSKLLRKKLSRYSKESLEGLAKTLLKLKDAVGKDGGAG